MEILKLETDTVDMATVLGIHPRTLQKLAKDGWIEGRVGHNAWNVATTVRHYVQHVELTRLTGKP